MKFEVSFLTLRIFSATGGIEKVCRILGKSLNEIAFESAKPICILSSHDDESDAEGNAYFPEKLFSGFGNNKFSFIISAIRRGFQSKKIIISHVNLLPIVSLIKLLNPKVKIFMFAHGIEVWSMSLGYRKHLLRFCDRILCVSSFTQKEMEKRFNYPSENYCVLNNCLDPYLTSIEKKDYADSLKLKYGFSVIDKVIFTLTRMDSTERYKGYDRVIDAMAEIQNECPNLKYLLGGSFIEEEKKYIDEKINSLGLTGKVVFTGFIPDEKLAEHFTLCDFYVMPSYNEGFGIVFIEALFYGLPVVGGNIDGTIDALDHGNFGLLIDPMDIGEISKSIVALYHGGMNLKVDQSKVLAKFGYDIYKLKIKEIFFN